MKFRLLVIGSVLLCVATGLFASGSSDTRKQEWLDSMLESAESYEGTYTMVEDRYPALVDADGETWYLLPGVPFNPEDMPNEGDRISVMAVDSRISPVHIRVIQATVNGTELVADFSRKSRRGYHRMHHMMDDNDGYYDNDWDGGNHHRGNRERN